MKKLIFLSVLTVFFNMFAALTITTDVSSTEEGNSTEKIFVDTNNLRIDMKTASILFDTKKQIMTTIMHDRKIYIEMTKAQMDEQKKMMDTLIDTQIKTLESQKVNMTADQQKALDEQIKIMRNSKSTAKHAADDIRATKRTETVGSWKCKIYEGYTEKRKDSEMCTVPFNELKISDADFKIIDDIAKIIGEGESSLKIMKAMKKIGYPVKESSMDPYSGTAETVRTLKSISRDKINPSTFKAPADYQKKTVEEMMGM